MITYEKGSHPSVERIAKLRNKMLEEGIDWLVITTADPHLSEGLSECDKVREYYSGFTGSAGTLVINETEAFLWTDSRYYVQAQEELNYSEIKLMKDGTKGVPGVNEYIAGHVWPGQTIGFDYRRISARKYNELRDLSGEDINFVNASKMITECWDDIPARQFESINVIDDKTAGKSSADKIDDIRKLIEKYLKDDEISYSYIVSDLCSNMWITNLRGCDIENVPVAYSYLIINNYSAVLFVKKKALSKDIEDKLNDAGIIIKDYGMFERELREIASDCVMFDDATNNASLYEILADYNVVNVKDSSFIKKYIKNEAEIEGMKAAHILDAKVMISFIKEVKDMASKGISSNEYELGKKLDEMRLSEAKCESLSFDTICGFNSNGAIVHYKAPDKDSMAVKSDGLLLVDSGAHYEFGTTDITRTIVLGNISNKAKECYTAVLMGNLRLMSTIFAEGVKGENLDVIAREPIWEAGYDYGHGTGHGIGCKLSVHEPYVTISYRSNLGIALQAGMVVSDEPGIYLEGEFGIRLENALLVKNVRDNILGFESLTLVPFDKDAILTNKLSERDVEILNNYHKRVYDVMSENLDEEHRNWLYEACQPI